MNAPNSKQLHEKLIFEHSHPGRGARGQWPKAPSAAASVPEALRRKQRPLLPEVSELDVVRHYTRLSQLNFSIDTHFYPLGSCTMKYNPKACNAAALLPEFVGRHPLAPVRHGQGFLACMYELQEMLKAVTGMRGVALSPLAGAHGEFAGVAMIRAYHRARGDLARNEIIVPEAAHGTNPATATMCGCIAREVAVDSDGDVDLSALRAAVGPKTAGIMLTNPSTLGVFERRIEEVARIVHEAGGLLYYDGANLNAILGKVRPGDMGFDVIHMNLHKTFSTPHGGGGPGAGAVGVSARLLPFLPLPVIGLSPDGSYRWLAEKDLPQSIGRMTGFGGNAGVLLRAYVYMRMLGREGMRRVGEFATLNANYLFIRLQQAGFEAAFPQRRASHEFILTLKRLAQQHGVTAMDVAKRLLDLGFHAPTTYFPLLISECLLIEPTETESKETLDAFVAAMAQILREAQQDPEYLHRAPHTMPVRRLDDVRAAKELDLVYRRPTG
jgi:glycine dehydrogenase subunit 2